MTNNEAAKWIQLYIDLAKIDPTTGEAAYLNDDNKKTIEAMEMAITVLTKEAWKEEHPVSPILQKLATNLQPCKQDADDTISRQAAINKIMGQPPEAHYPSWYAEQIKALPSAQPEIIRCKDCKHGMYDMMCKFYWCHGVAHSANWFCADAERRNDG